MMFEFLSLLKLNMQDELLWIVFPLAVATIVMLVYFEKYSQERPGWNTYVANSLVLLFVSMTLFRYLYAIDGAGIINFVNFPVRFIVSFGILVLGVIILFLNFEHFFPEKVARYVSSPLTLNLIAYIVIIYVYSDLENNFGLLFSLLILFISLLFFFNFLRIPIKKLFLHLQKMKEREKIEDILQEKVRIKKMKKKIAIEEKKVREAKIKELDKQKKEALKLKKIVNYSLSLAFGIAMFFS